MDERLTIGILHLNPATIVDAYNLQLCCKYFDIYQSNMGTALVTPSR